MRRFMYGRAERKMEYIKELEARITQALEHCPVCSHKPGMPTLCDTCITLRDGEWVIQKEPFKVRRSGGVILDWEGWYRK